MCTALTVRIITPPGIIPATVLPDTMAAPAVTRAVTMVQHRMATPGVRE